MFQNCSEKSKHRFRVQQPYSENHVFYVLMLKKLVDPDMPQTTE